MVVKTDVSINYGFLLVMFLWIGGFERSFEDMTD